MADATMRQKAFLKESVAGHGTNRALKAARDHVIDWIGLVWRKFVLQFQLSSRIY
ncbi:MULTISPECIES: hypothetical protein [unclassified Bradyrhizobium]|uniref:hypothetical protein n=1 Tax=unclassified Bradyrhizobium TaxID=2631580 RepID=UPI001FF95004|nr:MULTISPECIES: hypothetical protein [unclassified Bradyrhizobium]MCK1709638.1 hypothetical protein [Bradyrhizobium sp. 143]MCK1731595.1 hypothetical protein [Bradyrhizobium sp. 142]